MCTRDGQDFLVGITRPGDKKAKRSAPIPVIRVVDYNIDIDDFLNKTLYRDNWMDRDAGHHNSASIQMLDKFALLSLTFWH